MRNRHSGTVRFTSDEGVGKITLSNEQNLNAMNLEMWGSLRDALVELSSSPEIRVISIQGEGEKAFSSGSDISDLVPRSVDEGGVANVNDRIQETLAVLEAVPIPTVAEIRGYCLGAGTAIAASCDMRLLRDDVVIGIPAAKLGVGYDPRWVFSLVKLVGAANASRLLYTGERYDAFDAKSMGFATEVFKSDAFELMSGRLIRGISRNAPLTIRAVKQAILCSGRSGEQAELESLLALANDCFRSEDYLRGVEAFRNRVTPSFKGR
ncbi:MAG: enoyl-CoA hydratase/isomerase family protein [Ectothiorhodospiraceae bacterium]|nr:enoyl-CoA hydratase/isomerase family protein [Ectothiorhodospiraceae bacterium]